MIDSVSVNSASLVICWPEQIGWQSRALSILRKSRQAPQEGNSNFAAEALPRGDEWLRRFACGD